MMSDELENTNNKGKSKHEQSREAPPDGGWGWVVVFSAFMVGFLVDGVSFTFGILLPELLGYYKSSRGQTSWIGSVFNGSYLGIGPVASGLVNLFGCRKVAIAGAVMASTALFLSSYSPNVPTMIVLYGLLGGIGFGFMYLPSLVMVGFYFSKKRALATGIAVCGSGIGGFVFAPLTEKLLQEYSWKGAMWIISALVLNGVVICSVLRPLETMTKSLTSKENTRENSLKKNTGDKHKSDVEHSDVPKSYNNSNGYNYVINPQENSTDKISSEAINVFNSSKDTCFQIHETSSVKNLKAYQTVDERYSDEKYSKVKFLLKKTYGSIRLMFDFSLLRSPTFVIYGFSCFLCMMGFFIPFTYLPDLSISFGFSSFRSAWLISIIGIFNTVARVVVGYISDRKWTDCLLLNNCALLVGGVVTLFVPFYSIYGVLAVYSGIFGICIAAFVSLRSIIMVELLGLERLANSFGLVTMCQGLSAFIGSPIAGALTDVTGDYKAAFYFSGASLALAGVICFPLRRIVAWENAYKERDTINIKREHAGVNDTYQDRNNALYTDVEVEIL